MTMKRLVSKLIFYILVLFVVVPVLFPLIWIFYILNKNSG